MATGRKGSSGYVVTGVGQKKDWRPQGVVKNQGGDANTNVPNKSDPEIAFGPPTNSPSGGIVSVTRSR